MSFGRLQRHNRLVYALENWRQLQFLKDEMMIQIYKPHTIRTKHAQFQSLHTFQIDL